MNGNSPSSGAGLTQEQILQGLEMLNHRLVEASTTGELCLFRGALMVLAFRTRIATKDVDAIFQPTALIRKLAREVADEIGWPAHWLNDGVKGFISTKHEVT